MADAADWLRHDLDMSKPLVGRGWRAMARTPFSTASPNKAAAWKPLSAMKDAAGAWRRYYAHWRHMTGERLDPRLIQLVPTLAALVPPATVSDKAHCSPFKEQAFLRFLGRLGADAMILSGGETDVCVLAAVTDAGYRVILAEDALCSASDESQTPSCGNSARASASRSRSRRSRRSSTAGAQ